MNDTRELALILRLVACELTGETRSIFELRRVLALAGWTEADIDATARRVRAALYRQGTLMLEAA